MWTVPFSFPPTGKLSCENLFLRCPNYGVHFSHTCHIAGDERQAIIASNETTGDGSSLARFHPVAEGNLQLCRLLDRPLAGPF